MTWGRTGIFQNVPKCSKSSKILQKVLEGSRICLKVAEDLRIRISTKCS